MRLTNYSGGSGGSYDGSVVVAARLDTSDIRAGSLEIQNILTKLKDSAQRNFSMMRASAVSESRSAVIQVPAIARQMLDNTVSSLRTGQSAVVGAVRGVMRAALSEMRSQAQQFSSIGTQMMSEVASGISLSSQSVSAAARRTAQNAVSAMKAELGIQSPSRVMRDEIGIPIGRGVAEGMLDSVPLLTQAAGTLSASCLSGAQAQSVGSASQLLRGGASVSLGQSAWKQERLISASASAGAGIGASGTKKVLREPVGTTIVFNKPVETPYAHARAIRETMEEMLYG